MPEPVRETVDRVTDQTRDVTQPKVKAPTRPQAPTVTSPTAPKPAAEKPSTDTSTGGDTGA